MSAFNKTKIQNLLLSIYEDPQSIASFSGIKKLYAAARKINPKITLKHVKEFLASQDSYSLHRLTNKKYKVRKIITAKPKIIVCLDLIDMTKIAEYNDNFRYLALYSDLFSRKITVIGLKDKSKHALLSNLQSFLP